MAKYALNRVLRGVLSIIIVVTIVMVLIYSLLDRNLIFASDGKYSKVHNNDKEVYKYQRWEEFGYVDYVPFSDYLQELNMKGEIDMDTRLEAAKIGRKETADSELTKQYVQKFTEYYESQGYTVKRLPAKMMSAKKVADGGKQQLFAYRDKPLISRLWTYFTSIISVDRLSFAEEEIEDRGIKFTLHDPVYGGDKFAPAIIGNGTRFKYLLYTDSEFPFIHQNLISISLGKSYSVRQGIDVFDTMFDPQGSYKYTLTTFPTGLTEESADNLHSASYVPGSIESGTAVVKDRFNDNYTSVINNKNAKSKVGFSFTIGIIASFFSYLFGVPIGVIMARKKDKLVDKIGTVYIIFIIAVPSLAYIFLFKAIGGAIGLPTTFDMENMSWLMYVLPIVSLALPSIAGLMKWIRRYMIDQMNSDYVKFARSGGLSEREIFSKHILKNAAIPIIHGIPGTILGAMTGAIVTERVYVVPGAGNLLTEAINRYDNGVIVGVTIFYAILSVLSIIMGDILMAIFDPRISFTNKAR